MRLFFNFFIYVIFSFVLISCSNKESQEKDTSSAPNQKNITEKPSEGKQEIKSDQNISSPRFRDESKVLNETEIKKSAYPEINNSERAVSVKQNFNKGAGDIAELFKKIKKPAQIFSINPRKDTMLICKEGMRLTIPAFGFVYEDGRPARDSIRIEVTEFLSKKDFLLANLSTSSDGAMLETGGMLDVKAFSGKKKVKLQRDASVLIEVPTQTVMPDMELFYGNHDAQGRVNWKKEDSRKSRLRKPRKKTKPERIFATLSKVISYTDTTGLIFDESKENHEWADSARKTQKIDSIEFSYTINRKGELKDGAIYKNNKLVKNEKLRFGYWYRIRSIVPTATYSSKYTSKLNFNSNTNYFVSAPGIIQHYDLWSADLKDLRNKIKETKGSVTVRVKHVYCKNDTLLTYNYWKYKAEKRAEAMDYLKKDSSAMTAFKTSYYVFEATQLNWINIDRFYKSKTPMVPFVVKTEEGKYADVKVVFKKINSVLPGMNVLGKSEFGTMPQGEQVTVVAVMVKEGTTYLATKDISIQPGTVDGLVFQSVSVEELKTRIAQIY